MRKLFLFILSVLAYTGAFALQKNDTITASLITCWPGPEVYELCGHEAVRIRGIVNGKPIDTVWNYGTFDFDQPNFIYRFVKGETDYMLSSYPFRYFLPEYQEAGRRVVEQDLNLSTPEAHRLLTLLSNEAIPPNNVYRYNYVKDNCATRILNRIDDMAGAPVVYPDSVSYGTFRNEMRAYHKNYPWYQFGIDLALGSGLDYQLKGREEMFVPLEMMRKAAGARLPDGRPLVSTTRVLNEGIPDATLGPSPWYTTPMFWSSMFLLFTICVCAWQYRKRKIAKFIYSVWFALLGLAGCLVTFLVFISVHEATSPNILILWLNPLQFIIAAGVWFPRGWRLATKAMIYVNIVLMTVLLIVWPLQSQSANPAFFPLMGATLLLAASYAILEAKISLKNKKKIGDEEVYHLGAVTGRHRSTGSGRGRQPNSRKTTSRGRNRR